MIPQIHSMASASGEQSIVVIGTRGSALALWQSDHVAALLQRKIPGLKIEIKKIKTTGDKILDSPLSKIGDKGLFTKELDRALLDFEADIAVHSLKDIPTQVPEGLTIAAILEREEVRDIFIPNPAHAGLKLGEVPEGGEIATGSLRRRCQLLNLRPDIRIADIRGNLDSRIRKLKDSGWSGMILAYAGITRLGMNQVIGEVLPVSIMLPAVGQGAVAVMARQDDITILSMLESLDHRPTRLATLAERALLRRMEGGCQIPIGAYASLTGNRMDLQALVGSLDGTQVIRDSCDGNPEDYERLGTELADRLVEKGAGDILNEIRKITKW